MLTKLQKIIVGLTIGVLVIAVNFLFFYNLYKHYFDSNSSLVPTYRNVNNGGDQMVYFSLIKQSAEGKNVLLNLYTNETQIGLVSPLWWLIGKLVKITTIPIPIMYYLLTMVSGFLLLSFVFNLSKKIFHKFWQQLVVLPILSLSGGLGIFYIGRILFPDNGLPLTETDLLSKTVSADLWLGEGFGFSSLRHSPLFILSQLALLLLFWWVAERAAKAKWWENLAVGLGVFLLTLVHPYDTVVLAVFIFIYGLVNWCNKIGWKNWFKMVPLGVGALLAVIYFFYLKAIDPSFYGWSMQNITRTPFPLSLLAGYLLLIIPASYGCLLAWREKNSRLQWLVIWLLASALLIVIPSQVQRRFASGVYIPLAILAWYGWLCFWQNKNKYLQIIIGCAYSFLLVLTFVVLMGLNIKIINNNKLLTFMSLPELQALTSYAIIANNNQILLTNYTTGNIIPAYISRKVYIGHGHQTVNWQEKLYFSNWFFITKDQEKVKHDQLVKRGIDFVWFGPTEKELNINGLNNESYFKKVFTNDEVVIYQVLK